METARHIGLLALYITVTVGMTIATHFCGGDPVSASLLNGTGQRTGCCCGDEGQMEGCCTTSITTLRVDDAHMLSSETASTTLLVEPMVMAAHRPLPAVPPAPVDDLVRPPGNRLPTHLLSCPLLI